MKRFIHFKEVKKMEDEKVEMIEEVTEEEETDQVINLLTQIQEQLVNVQKALDTMSPVTETEPEPEPETEPEPSEPPPEELEEIDKLLNDDY